MRDGSSIAFTSVDYVVGDSTLSVEHHHEMPVQTTGGAVQSWEVRIAAPDFSHTARVGIASSAHDVSPALVATIVEVGMLTIQPGSRDNDPFAAAEVRAWIGEHRAALEALVAEIRS